MILEEGNIFMALEDFKYYLGNHPLEHVEYDLDYDFDYYGDYCYMEVTLQYYYSSTYDDDGSDWRKIEYDLARGRRNVYDALSYANSRYGAKIELKRISESNTYDPD